MKKLSKQTQLLVFVSLFLQLVVSAADTIPVFDVSEFKPSAFQFGGYIQAQNEYISFDKSSALYRLRFDPSDNYDFSWQTTGTLELEASYSKGMAQYNLRTYSSYLWDDIDENDDEHELYEAYLSLEPDPSFSVDIGKKLNRWGKGYAWNPVGFVERKKDPSDPDLSREGYWVQTMDFIHSMEGDLKTIAFTPVVLPNNGHVNEDFGEPDHNNFAFKLYFLLRDIDIDIMYLNGASKTARFGFDFAYNIAPNFAIHGEYAYISDSTKTPLTTSCSAGSTIIEDVSSYLLGLRYRTDADITFITEYYHNGEGVTEEEINQYFSCVHQAWNTGDSALLQQLTPSGNLNKGEFTTQNVMQNYLHLKSWWNEPNDILYFVPGIQLIYNLDDSSYLLTPEILYTGINNLQIRLRYKFFSGDELTEYGEKASERKFELRLRYYF